jgi:hypothetical protein
VGGTEVAVAVGAGGLVGVEVGAGGLVGLAVDADAGTSVGVEVGAHAVTSKISTTSTAFVNLLFISHHLLFFLGFTQAIMAG